MSNHLKFHFPGFLNAFLSWSCSNLIVAPFWIRYRTRSHLCSRIYSSVVILNAYKAMYKGHLLSFTLLQSRTAGLGASFIIVLSNLQQAIYWTLAGPFDFPIWAALLIRRLIELTLIPFSRRKMALGLEPALTRGIAF